MAFTAKALLGLSLAFSGAVMASPVDDLAKDAQAMAHEIIRAAQDIGATRSERASRMEELIRQDHTILLGNHAGMLSVWGADSNVVLARHHTIPQRLRSCSVAIDAQTEPAEKRDQVASCIGNMRDMAQFGIVAIDEGRLAELRNRLAALKPR